MAVSVSYAWAASIFISYKTMTLALGKELLTYGHEALHLTTTFTGYHELVA